MERKEKTSRRCAKNERNVDPKEPKPWNLISSLENNPAKSLVEVYHVVKMALKSLSESLKNLEEEFYGRGGTAFEEIARWKFSALLVMQVARTELWSVKQLDEVEKAVIIASSMPLSSDISGPNTGRPSFKVTMADMEKVQTAVNKIRAFLPSRFEPLISKLQRVSNIAKTYCDSFYDPNTEYTVDTCLAYENSRRSWIQTMDHCLQIVPHLGQSFCSEQGVSLQGFTEAVQSLAHQQDCQKLHGLFLFPEACERFRAAFAAVEKWIEEDKNYGSYLEADIQELSSVHLQSLRARLQETQVSFHKTNFHRKQLASDINALRTNKGNTHSEDRLESEACNLTETIVNLEADLNLKMALKDLKRREDESATKQSKVTSTETIDQMEMRLTKGKKRLHQIKMKQIFISKRKNELKDLLQQEEHITEECLRLVTIRNEAQNNLESAEKRVSLLKSIHRLKTTADALARLHYQLPLPSKIKGNAEDAPLLKACRVIAEEVGDDWMRLYGNLPFEPERGNILVEQDILNILLRATRERNEEQANKALLRWLRYHKRACVGDLNRTLHCIGRADVAKTMHTALNPPIVQRSSEQIEGRGPPVGPELLPFYKMVERFDVLRLAGKI